MICTSLAWDRYAAFGRFCAILLGIAITWTCAIYGLLVVTASTCGDRSVKLAQLRVRSVEGALAMYDIDHGRCPNTTGDLVTEEYLAKGDAADPWGTTIAISCSPDDWSARSAGSDRRFGTADDITRRY